MSTLFIEKDRKNLIFMSHTVSAHISEELFKKVEEKKDQHYHGKRSVYIAELIRRDLEGDSKPITENDEDCFMVIAKEFIDKESRDSAEDAFKQHRIKQSHFLSHVIRQAAQQLNRLKPGQDWHDISCIIDANAENGDDPDPEVVMKTDAWRKLLEKIDKQQQKMLEQMDQEKKNVG